MEIRYLSASSIKVFLQCKLQFLFKQLRELPQIKNDNTGLGSAIHYALEEFTKRMDVKKSFPNEEDYDFATKLFLDKAVDLGLEDFSSYADGREMLVRYIGKHDPQERVLAVEKKFKLKTPDGIPITGAIDKVVQVNDDTIMIIDYKTSRTALSSWELKSDIQLSMYDYATSLMWPEFKNRILVLDYVRLGKAITTYRSDEERVLFGKFLNTIWEKIKSLNRDEIKGNLNKFCGWCDYKDHCPEYGNFIRHSSIQPLFLSEMSENDFIEHWVEVRNKKALFDNREKEMRMVASQYFVENGEHLRTDSYEVYTSQSARVKYEPRTVLKTVPMSVLPDVVSINKDRLDRFLKENPSYRTDIDNTASSSFNAPTWKIKDLRDQNKSEEAEEDESGGE